MKPDLSQLVKQWQCALRLLDWRLQVEYVRDLKASDGSPVYGLCWPHVDAKRARIQIRDPETPFGRDDPAVEETLIHELLHLHFAPLSGSTSAEIAAEEQAVWAITEAIASSRPREAQMIARAMRAIARQRKAPRRQGQVRMEPKLIMEALNALVAGDAAKCMEILKGIIAASAGAAGGGEPAPPEQAAPPESEEPEKEPMQRPAPVAAARAASAVGLAGSGGVSRAEFDRLQTELLIDRIGANLTEAERAFAVTLSPVQARAYLTTKNPGQGAAQAAAGAPAGAARQQAPSRAAGSANVVTRADLERFQVATLLDVSGQHLTEAERAFAATLNYEQARTYLATRPAGETEAPAGVQRRSSPTQGARSQTVTDPTIAEIDRRMRVNSAPEQAVTIDPLTRKLSISALRPVRTQVAEGGK